MAVRLGYACVNTLLPSTSRTTRLDRADPQRLLDLARANLAALYDILRWNRAQRIPLFRISSGIIPFGSHPINRLPWWEILQPELKAAGDLIRQEGLRVSMHPGQYTVLNSTREEVVAASLAELEYHARFLDALSLDSSHKIILHLGGAYGDKPESMRRFAANFTRLSPGMQRRLVLENDEKVYTLADALAQSAEIGIPVVFDVFHHGWNPSFQPESLRTLIQRAAATWKPADGRQKIHYSNPWPGKPPGSHSQSVDLDAFAQFYMQVQDLDLDIMLEVKDKEQSVLALYQQIPALRAG
jgi:UV DNA damage endonuclease